MLGSLLVFIGFVTLSYGHLKVLKELIYENVRLGILIDDTKDEKEEIKKEEPVTVPTENPPAQEETKKENKVYYNYIGYLEIPKIRLKRGFVDRNSKYNNIQYNVTISNDGNMPDVENGNFILYAHSGDAYISYFAYLYKLQIGDYAYVTYNDVKYTYQLVKIENLPKTGILELSRPSIYTKELTLITCTKDSDTEQTVYYFDIR